ncbi:IS3 family transposase [Arthrobacter sp. 35W]|uniref:IS3 family transposase n=1 Tax=Arthrobacter sp. 35W TaxID=1132441 RepID=UPI000418CE9E|nr:IS3 family transposase [Arthrobacter sp. 35W]
MIILGIVAGLVAADWAVRAACRVAGVSHMYWYRSQAPETTRGIQIPHKDRAYPNRISEDVCQELLARLNAPEFEDLSITQAWHRLLDGGEYYASMACTHRIVKRAGQNGDRRPQRAPGTGAVRPKPVLEATGPNQVWCWDITDLHGPGRQHLKLYTVMDAFSRKVVGHRVEQSETAVHAAELMEASVLANWGAPEVMHADNGAAMRAGHTYDMYRMLGIRPSHSRPRTSNDNPFIESLFKTVKYSLAFPGRFDSLEHARDYTQGFFAGYNENHRHAGLNGYTPDSVHGGYWKTVRTLRQEVLDEHYARNPERYTRPPIIQPPPREVWINRPNHQLSHTA